MDDWVGWNLCLTLALILTFSPRRRNDKRAFSVWRMTFRSIQSGIFRRMRNDSTVPLPVGTCAHSLGWIAVHKWRNFMLDNKFRQALILSLIRID